MRVNSLLKKTLLITSVAGMLLPGLGVAGAFKGADCVSETKRPLSDYAKTRLGASIGTEQSAGVYARLLYTYLLDAHANLTDTRIELSVASPGDVDGDNVNDVAFAESLAITHGDEGIQVCLVCPQAVATRMTGFDDDGQAAGDTGFGGNDVDGIVSSDYVAECILEGIREQRFLVLPHPQVSTYLQRKADDPDRWIAGMRRFRQRLIGGMA